MVAEEKIWQLLSRWLTPDQGSIWRAATYRFHALVAERWHKGRYFIDGDAAHQTPPFMSQGLNQGRSDEQTSVLQSLTRISYDAFSSEKKTTEIQSHIRISYAVLCTKKKTHTLPTPTTTTHTTPTTHTHHTH